MTAIGTISQAPITRKSELGRLRDAVGEVVGSVFYGTLLKTMRNSELKGPFGHGGQGEEIFAARLHAIMAADMGKAAGGSLTDALFDRLANQQRLVDRQRSKT